MPTPALRASLALFVISTILSTNTAADVVVNQTNTPELFAEVNVNQDGANAVSMYVDVQDEPGGISGLALNSSATGDSTSNWSTAPLWINVDPDDVVPEVGTAKPDSLHNESDTTTLSSTFEWLFTLNADAGEQVTSIEVVGLQVSGRNGAYFDALILGDGWSDFVSGTDFSSSSYQTIVTNRLYDASFDSDVVGGNRLFLGLTYSAPAGADSLRMFEEDAGVTTDRFRITVNFSNAVPEPGSTGVLLVATLVLNLRRRRRR